MILNLSPILKKTAAEITPGGFFSGAPDVLAKGRAWRYGLFLYLQAY